MSRDSRFWLQDIERACERILRYVGERPRDEALGDDLILDGVLMNFHVIGEAVKRLPSDLKEKAGAVSWEVEASTVAEARDALAKACPPIAGQLGACRFALDDEFVEGTTPVPDGATVDVIPLVSGG